ncbi:YgjP-like metallopeptidase domain-containing protein [Lysobacter sp. F6437]|uniref:YgjP-like metallopeptidase domain-containing protein n=1 Tax=Lysobacter sp. F6437 TaxID=3459296 RepID=UPI00403DDA80
MPNPFRLLAPKPRTIERDAFELVLADGQAIEVLRVRDPRARRIKLSVDERGARLTLPTRASRIAGERFAIEHRDWLAAQIQRHALDAMPRLQPFHSDRLPLRGAEVPLRWQTGRLCMVQHEAPAVVDGGRDNDGSSSDSNGNGNNHESRRAGLVFTVSARAGSAAIARALRDFYEAEARADVGRWLPRYLAGLPRPPRRFRFKQMSSQWGSLAPDGSIALDLSLVLARPSAFEYVLVHELCHLIRPDHSRVFWREVESRCPRWRGERDYFRTEGRRLKAGLRALLDVGDDANAGKPG